MKAKVFIYLKSIFLDLITFLIKYRVFKLNSNLWSDIHLRYFKDRIHSPSKVNKIAFFITDSIVWDHMQQIMKTMPYGSFDIILANYKPFFNRSALLELLSLKKVSTTQSYWHHKFKDSQANQLSQAKGCQVTSINEVFLRDEYVTIVVCSTSLECSGSINSTKRPSVYGASFLASNIALCQFSLDVQSTHYTARSNADHVFLPGPWSKKQCEIAFADPSFKFFWSRISVPNPVKIPLLHCVGTPRFERQALLPTKKQDCLYQKTILWLPTHTEGSSILYFLSVMNNLGNNYKVILKPHPLCFDEIKDLNEKISFHSNINLDMTSSHHELLCLADYVFCDYGGSVFGAIYYDKNILFLNCPDVTPVAKLLTSENPEFLLRSEIINFNVGEEDKILAALQDETIWEKQKPIRAAIKKQFFTVDEEPASKKIVRILMEQLEKDPS